MLIHFSFVKKIQIVCLILLLSTVMVGQESLVRRLTAETDNRITIRLWVENPLVKFGDGVRIHLQISNRSGKPIYLVRKESPEFYSHNNEILIEAPLPFSTGHGGYDYTFKKINSGSSFVTFLDIPKEHIKETGRGSIRVGLGFVNDISGINRKLEWGEDPVRLRNPLATRMRTFAIGDLEINVFRQEE